MPVVARMNPLVSVIRLHPGRTAIFESFFGRFKQEFGDVNRFETIGETLAAVYQHIHYYNHRRIHTALRMPPAVFAAQAVVDNRLPILGT